MRVSYIWEVMCIAHCWWIYLILSLESLQYLTYGKCKLLHSNKLILHSSFVSMPRVGDASITY